NPALLPEKATTMAIGVVLQPRFLPGFSGTIDWFDIRLDGGITTIGGDTIMNTCLATGDPLFCSRIHRDAGGTLWETPQGFVDDRNANVGSLKTNGIDVGASYTHRLGKLGKANFEFNGSWTHRFIIDPGGLSTPYDCAAVYGQVCGFPLPRWRHNLRSTWDMPGGVSLSVFWRHTSPIPIDQELAQALFGVTYNPAASRIRAQDFFDTTLIYRVGDRYSLRFGVRNIFDREPPILPSGQFAACGPPLCNGNTVPQLYDPLGRFFFVGATIYFKP
ncbi:MAG: TonB-dependent receptor, partial [Sphingomonas sp.]|nr:TonB-dependent receptor [Sphingomonas sp.]